MDRFNSFSSFGYLLLGAVLVVLFETNLERIWNEFGTNNKRNKISLIKNCGINIPFLFIVYCQFGIFQLFCKLFLDKLFLLAMPIGLIY